MASRSHNLIKFSLAFLDTGAANKAEGQPIDDDVQQEGEEQGEVIGEALVQENQAGTSADPLGAVRSNVVVEEDEEEEEDEDNREEDEEDKEDPTIDEDEHMRLINQ